MKISLSILFSTLAVASASHSENDVFLRRGPNNSLIPRQNGSQPIVGDLTNAQLETAYVAQCNTTNSATGQAQILADIQNATTNAVAIDVGPNSMLRPPFVLMRGVAIVQSNLRQTDGRRLGESQQRDLVCANVAGHQTGYFTRSE
jgi:hypothetical protein